MYLKIFVRSCYIIYFTSPNIIKCIIGCSISMSLAFTSSIPVRVTIVPTNGFHFTS